ncbi:MAG: beta-lactamase family protein [Clostridiaceae bacterium]|nr:beta-lactamase family protein [Clostridiaceae bacterium]
MLPDIFILLGSTGDYYLKNYPGTSNEEKIMNGIIRGDIKVAFPPPGSSFRYSDINYMIIGYIVEKVSGTQW